MLKQRVSYAKKPSMLPLKSPNFQTVMLCFLLFSFPSCVCCSFNFLTCVSFLSCINIGNELYCCLIDCGFRVEDMLLPSSVPRVCMLFCLRVSVERWSVWAKQPTVPWLRSRARLQRRTVSCKSSGMSGSCEPQKAQLSVYPVYFNAHSSSRRLNVWSAVAE